MTMEAQIRSIFASANAADKPRQGDAIDQAEMVIHVEHDSAGYWRVTENGVVTLLKSHDELMEFFASIITSA